MYKQEYSQWTPWRNPFAVPSKTSAGLFVSIFGHWKTVSGFGSVGGSPEESNKNDQRSGECDLQGKMESCLDWKIED